MENKKQQPGLTEQQFVRLLLEKPRQTITHIEQFAQWIRCLFYISGKLKDNIDLIYLDTFFIKVAELFRTGKIFMERVCRKQESGANNGGFIEQCLLISPAVEKILSLLDEKEIKYIVYLRDCYCHIFQDSYEIRQENNKFKEMRSGEPIDALRKGFVSLIEKHGSEENFKLDLLRRILPVVLELKMELGGLVVKSK